ncbi:MAG: hypothetical protein JW918_16715 [Anaerolineae bacterium]|nr:hypothetical protein [Anaerolineae bacterium]
MEATPIIFLLGIVLAAAAILASAAASGGDRQRIRQHLVERGATGIFIAKAWTPGDRGTNTYDVAFTDSQGEQRRTRCQVRRNSWFGNPEIDWEDTV